MAKRGKRIVKGGLLISGGALGSSIIGFLNTLLMVRILGGGGYGAFSRIMAPAFFLIKGATNIGESQALIRFAPHHESRGEIGEVKAYFTSALIFRALYIGVIGALIIVLSPTIARFVGRAELASSVAISGIFISSFAISGILSAASIALKREWLYLLISTATSGLRMLFLLVFVLAFEAGVLGAVFSLAIAQIIAVLSIFPFFLSYPGLSKEGIKTLPRRVKEMASFGLPIAIQIVLSGLSPEIPLLVLASKGTDLENAFLRSSDRYIAAAILLIRSFERALLPHMSEDMAALDRRAIALKAAPYFAFISMGIGSIFLGMPKTLMALLSPDLVAGATVLRIMGLAILSSSIASLHSLAFVEGRKELALIGIGMLSTSGIASIALSRLGAEWISICYPAIYLSMFLGVLALSRRMGISLGEEMRGLVRLLAATVLTAGALSVLDSFGAPTAVRFILGMVLAILLFPSLAVAFKGLRKEKLIALPELIPLPKFLSVPIRSYVALLAKIAR